MPIRKRSQPDVEMATMNRFCQQLISLNLSARRRVLAYVNARAESLPLDDMANRAQRDEDRNAELAELDPPHMPPLLGTH